MVGQGSNRDTGTQTAEVEERTTEIISEVITASSLRSAFHVFTPSIAGWRGRARRFLRPSPTIGMHDAGEVCQRTVRHMEVSGWYTEGMKDE